MRHENKTAVKSAANEQLRWERLRRGWSRAYIAEQIGVADPKTIGRWERGDAFPSAYFLQRLCALFAMPAEELGLCQHESQQPLAESTPAAPYFTPASIFCDPALPPAHTEKLIGRDQLFAQLKARLSGKAGPALAALNGLPGVGKTALAVSLAHDSEIQQHFSAGVLWACLGPDADLLGELKRWATLLGIEESTILHAESVEDWTRAIHARIGSRSMLLVIDDAWTCQEALAFKIGGPNCAYLLTTRIPAVALYFGGAGAIAVKTLDEKQSLALLARFVPTIVEQAPAETRALARLAGGLPLALQLMGMHLQAHAYSGQPRRWRAALERLKQPAERLQIAMPRAPLERQMGLPADEPISLLNEIELSYRLLSPQAQQTLLTLAGLAARTGSFSEEAALALNGVTLETLDTLLDAGLLASAGLGRYTLHQTIVDFARFQEEQTYSMEDMPPQVRVLRQLRERGAYVAENVPRQAYALEKVLPALAVQGSSETVIFASSQ